MSTALDLLAQEIEELSTVSASFLAYHDAVVAELRANANDPAKVAELADKLEAIKAPMMAAMTKNTVAENEPTPAPVADTLVEEVPADDSTPKPETPVG